MALIGSLLSVIVVYMRIPFVNYCLLHIQFAFNFMVYVLFLILDFGNCAASFLFLSLKVKWPCMYWLFMFV